MANPEDYLTALMLFIFAVIIWLNWDRLEDIVLYYFSKYKKELLLRIKKVRRK